MHPISDMFIRIQNAARAGRQTVRFPYSAFRHAIASALERAGYAAAVSRKGKRVKKILELELPYSEGRPAVNGVRLISKPSRRVWASWREIGRARHGGIIIVSTPQGVLSHTEARAKHVGGEVLAEIW